MKVRARSNAGMRAGAVVAWSLWLVFSSIWSFLERVVDHLLHRRDHMHAPGRRILHHHEKHVLSAIDHDVAAGGAVPFDLAERAPGGGTALPGSVRTPKP